MSGAPAAAAPPPPVHFSSKHGIAAQPSLSHCLVCRQADLFAPAQPRPPHRTKAGPLPPSSWQQLAARSASASNMSSSRRTREAWLAESPAAAGDAPAHCCRRRPRPPRCCRPHDCCCRSTEDIQQRSFECSKADDVMAFLNVMKQHFRKSGSSPAHRAAMEQVPAHRWRPYSMHCRCS